MTLEEKIESMQVQLDANFDARVLGVYLRKAQQEILNKRFPYGEQPQEIEPKYEQLQIELAVVLFNERGAEGQSSHNENGVSRSWRTKEQILCDVVPYAEVL